MDRRGFLRTAGLAAVAGTAAACTTVAGGPAAPSGTPTPSPTAPPTSAPPAGPPDWAALRARLGGGLVRPGESGYDTAKQIYDPAFDARRPAAVAHCRDADDVVACVQAAAGRVPVAARSGGHSYAGYSAPDGGLMLDLTALSAVDVRPDGTAVVGPGARLGDVYAALARAGRALPAGSCPTVGIGGLTLGGGIGVLTRAYGLTCDRLVAARVVTADGQVRTASAGSEPDLFWALRGGGGGNVGVVTELTLTTEPAPQLTVLRLSYPAGAGAAVLGGWQHWLPGAPDELWSTVALTGGAAVRPTISGCFVGTPAGLAPHLAALTAATGAPSSRLVRAMDYGAAMRYFAGSSARETFAASSRVLTDAVADPAALVDTVRGSDQTSLLVDALGGKVATLAPTDTAFWHRGALATVQIYAAATVADRPAAQRRVSGIVDALGKLGVGGGYVNYIDAAMPDWGRAYYGDNLPRLRQIARHYDPAGVFAFPQNVRSA